MKLLVSTNPNPSCSSQLAGRGWAAAARFSDWPAEDCGKSRAVAPSQPLWRRRMDACAQPPPCRSRSQSQSRNAGWSRTGGGGHQRRSTANRTGAVRHQRRSTVFSVVDRRCPSQCTTNGSNTGGWGMTTTAGLCYLCTVVCPCNIASGPDSGSIQHLTFNFDNSFVLCLIITESIRLIRFMCALHSYLFSFPCLFSSLWFTDCQSYL